MEAKIDFQSTNRFKLSFGLVIMLTDFVLALLFRIPLTEPSTSLILWFLIYLIGVGFFYEGYKGLRENEKFERKLKFEQMINQILEQDLRLLDIMNKRIEYNEKVRSIREKDKSIPLGTKPLEEVQHRGIELIIAQALDPDFYENTYPNIFKNINKKLKTNKKISLFRSLFAP